MQPSPLSLIFALRIVLTFFQGGDFASWAALLESSRLFVLDKVAAGTALSPIHIFALHLYTVCVVYGVCVCVCVCVCV